MPSLIYNLIIHGLLRHHKVEHLKPDIIFGCTGKESITQISDKDAEYVIRWLEAQYGKLPPPKSKDKVVEKSYWDDEAAMKLRKQLIAMSYSIGENTKFVIDWCEKMGVGEGAQNVKRKFNYYAPSELVKLKVKFEKVITDRINAVGKARPSIERPPMPSTLPPTPAPVQDDLTSFQDFFNSI